ncbi:MAG: hypothetical protein N3E39_02985 [Candidatus Methanomethylicia archaeon]|nr:hypothetical protein [Candidatus Methanomethylicia archaeon]
MKVPFIIGGDPLAEKIIEKLNKRYQKPNYWIIYNGRALVNLEEYEVNSISNDVKNSVIEDLVSESSEIIFTIPLEKLNNSKFWDSMDRILKYVRGIIDITIGIYQQMKNLEINLNRIMQILKDNKIEKWRILYFGEVYGEKVNLGIVFDTLKILSEDCINIRLPYHSEEKRNYLYIDDAARAILNKNIGDEKIMLIKDVNISNRILVKRITELIGVYDICNIKFNENAEIINPPEYPQPRNFKTRINLLDGLNLTIGWFEGEYEPIKVLPKNRR